MGRPGQVSDEYGAGPGLDECRGGTLCTRRPLSAATRPLSAPAKVRGLIWEDARGEARHDTLDAGLHGAVQHVVVDRQVVPEELHLVLHVGKEAANLGSEVNYMVGLVLVVDGLGLGAVPVRAHTTGPLSLWRSLNAQAGLRPP